MSRGAPGGLGVGTEDGEVAVLTVLFTDIEGSTALTERLGDERWVQVLSAHDAVVRRALRTHGGREVKTVGDGFMAAFAGAEGAVRAAADVHRLVRTVRIPEVRGGLRVRVGAHTGPVIYRAGDVLGRNVHVARRITTLAAGGQTLVTASCKVLADAGEGVRSGAPRTLWLKGLSEPFVVFPIGVDREPGAHNVHLLHPLHPAGRGLRQRSGA